MIEKKEVRKRMKELLAKHPPEEREQKSKKITSSLFELPEYKKAKAIMSYVSTGPEVSTRDFILSAFSHGKRIVVPAVNSKDCALTLHEIRSLQELVPGFASIPEPKDRSQIFPKSQVDLAVLPGLAFDEKCNRLGKGKAMFDRLLAGMECPKIALAFEFQLTKKVPTHEHDVPVGMVLTEERLIRRVRPAPTY
jgi:5-formyltetrahydrofolate cyclo-ligase